MSDASEAEMVDFADIQLAQHRLQGKSHRTPVLTCSTFDGWTGAFHFFKCENFQKGGAFKFRGACNAVFCVTEAESARGFVTHSSGNHGAALALAANLRGAPAWIVVPENAPAAKVAAIAGYGATIVRCQPNVADREATAQKILDKTGANFVHPYNDERVIAGQGTCALELLESVPDLDIVLAPVGGGGLLSGTALAVKTLRPATSVFGCEPSLADDAYRSLRAGSIQPVLRNDTIADGLRTGLGDRTFAILRERVDGIHRVDEDAIGQAMKNVWERMKIVIEPSAAVAVAVALHHGKSWQGKKVGVILSGGNIGFPV